MRTLTTLGLCGVLVAGLAGCGISATETPSVLDKSTIRIGVKADQPGLGLREPGGNYAGFDVDVARYVAGKLGFTADEITFVTTPSSVREKVLKEGGVDLIFATYSITAKRKTEVDFAGPYYVAHQDTAVRAGDVNVRNVRDLRGRKLCAVTGSNSWKRVIEERGVPAQPVQSESYSDCMRQLAARTVDAVSTDDLILAGFSAQQKGSVRILNAPISDEKYGVGIKKGDVDGCEAVNEAITEMYQDGTARRLLGKWFGETGLKPTTTVPQFEGCS
jgi:glutamate transport system substrate-binding protein